MRWTGGFLAGVLAGMAAAPACTQTPEWFGDPFSAVLTRARGEQKQVALYFWADGSAHCANLWSESLSTGPVATELAELVCYSADVARGEAARLLQAYHVQVLPTVVITDASGRVEDHIVGYLPQAEFLSQLQRIRAGTDTVGARRAAAAASPGDLNLRLQLALKLRDVGDLAAAESILQTIREADPKGDTLAGAEIQLFDARTAAVNAARPGSPPDPEPVKKLLRSLRQPSVAAKAWAFIATTEIAHGRHTAARDAWRTALRDLPRSQHRATAIQATFALWQVRESVAGSRMRFLADALEVQVRAEAESYDPKQATKSTLETNGLTLRAHGQALAMAGQKTEAIAALDRALKLMPNNDELLEVRRQLVAGD